jgi:hypothetical protein
MFHYSSCSSIPIYFTCVQYTLCIHTQSDIWTPEISGHIFPFCPSAPHVRCYDVASCTAHTFTGVASLCWRWRQRRYVRWALLVNLAHFLDVYNQLGISTRGHEYEKGYRIKNVVTFFRRQFPGKQQCWCQIWHPKSGIRYVLRICVESLVQIGIISYGREPEDLADCPPF